MPSPAVELFLAGLQPPAIAVRLGIGERRVRSELAAAGGEAIWTPWCMTAEEYSEWKGGRDWSNGKSQPLRPCHDCLLDFAVEKRAEGKCNGTPGAARDVDEEEGMPITPSHVSQMEGADRLERARALSPVDRLERRVDKSIDVDLELPCQRCQHAPVCSLRPTVELLARLPVALPRDLDRAVVVRLSGSVTCGHFLGSRKRQPSRTEVYQARSRRATPAELTPRQLEVLEAVRRQRGNRMAAAAESKVTPQAIDSTLLSIAKKGRMPADLVELLPARFHNAPDPDAEASA